MITITTSLVVDYNASDSPFLEAEIDGRNDGLNGGKTTFAGGERPAYLVFKSPDVSILQQITSMPEVGIAALPDQNVITEEFILFENEKESESSKYINSGFTFEWYGRSLGTISYDGKKLSVPVKGVAVAKITYTTVAKAFRLENVPSLVNGKGEFQILVHIIGQQS